MSQREIVLKNDDLIVSKTDLTGNIIYGNEAFIAYSGYSEEELIGAPHSILRHSGMPKLIFSLLWETIQSGEEIFAYVVNKTKTGDYYWVYANVTCSYDDNGRIIGYHSIRRRPSQNALREIQPLYAELLEKERRGGIMASKAYLESLLSAKGVAYEQFVFSL